MGRLGSVSSYSPFYNRFWIAAKLVYSFCEAIAGLLSAASIAVPSANVTLVDSGEVVRSAVYSRLNNGPRTLPWGMPAWTVD
jgi:hypothetical protein